MKLFSKYKLLFIIAFLIAIVFGFIYINNNKYDINNKDYKIALSFEDIIGTIKIGDNTKNLMQFDDNYFYLNHNYMRLEDKNGEFFLDYEGDLFNNKNAIIYTKINNINLDSIKKNDTIEILYLKQNLTYKIIDIDVNVNYKNDLVLKVIDDNKIINILLKKI